MAGALRGNAVRHARAADVEPWILSATARHSRRVPHELRADGACSPECMGCSPSSGASQRDLLAKTIWREGGSRCRTRDRSPGLGGIEPGARLCGGVRGACPMAFRIPLFICLRDGGCRADVSAFGAGSVHGNPGRHFRFRVRDRRAVGRNRSGAISDGETESWPMPELHWREPWCLLFSIEVIRMFSRRPCMLAAARRH